MSAENQPIFITGRFRAGTSLLWQLFDQLEGFCAWYEPLHPQLIAAIKYTEPKQDHVGIQDYWTTYRQHPEFESLYSMEFATKDLYLEEDDEFVELEAYINHLIRLSAEEVAVLQFNRMDLRLPWLRAKFPKARIIHIERNPLQLYHSQRKHITKAQRHDTHHWDAYELLPWCYALSEKFPFLLAAKRQHAFFQFYAIHQLSKSLGTLHADVTIDLDRQVFESDDFIKSLCQLVLLSDQQIQMIKSLIHVPDSPVFDSGLTEQLSSIMTEVEVELTSSGLNEYFGRTPLAEIKQQHSAFWEKYSLKQGGNEGLLLHIHQLNSEMTRVLSENNSLKNQLEVIQSQKHVDQNEAPTSHE